MQGWRLHSMKTFNLAYLKSSWSLCSFTKRWKREEMCAHQLERERNENAHFWIWGPPAASSPLALAFDFAHCFCFTLPLDLWWTMHLIIYCTFSSLLLRELAFILHFVHKLHLLYLIQSPFTFDFHFYLLLPCHSNELCDFTCHIFTCSSCFIFSFPLLTFHFCKFEFAHLPLTWMCTYISFTLTLTMPPKIGGIPTWICTQK